MARTKQILNDGLRLNDYIANGIMAKIIPLKIVKEILQNNEKSTMRNRKLPREFLVYYIISLAMYSNINIKSVLQAVISGMSFLFRDINKLTACDSAISQARTRLGVDAMKELFERICKPLATKKTLGAYFNDMLLVAVDGSHFELPDEADIRDEFPKHSNGVDSPFPLLNFAALMEVGTRVIFAATQGNKNTSEKALALPLMDKLNSKMLILGDRYYATPAFYSAVIKQGAHFLFRVKNDVKLPAEKILNDGSYLSEIKLPEGGKFKIRVIEYKIIHTSQDLNEQKETKVRLVTNLLKPKDSKATELAKLYCERWGIETAFREAKSTSRLFKGALRSKRANLAKQEFWGHLLAHFVIRYVIHESAVANEIAPVDISFTGAVKIIKTTIEKSVFPPNE